LYLKGIKAQHNNIEWRKALESAESLFTDKRSLENLEDYYVDELVDMRKKARVNKDWELSDRIRDYLDIKSVIIMDTTRKDLIDKLQNDKRSESLHEAWLYSIRKSIKTKEVKLWDINSENGDHHKN